jgi:diguanylate cyclase (GGDEF)-like protein/PAS domain S-box-containing protein
LLSIVGEIILNAFNHREANDLLKKYRLVSENARDIIFFIDCLDGRFTEANNAAVCEYGYTRDELLAMTVYDLWLPENSGIVRAQLDKASEKGFMFDTVQCRKDKTMMPAEVNLQKMTLGGRNLIICIVRNISERKRAENKLKYLAHHDILTNLPNRLLFNDRLTLELARAKRNGTEFCVMMLDLDAFKEINDTYGHHTGDLMLREVARRLKECLRESDTAARMAGDEFTLILPGVKKLDGELIAKKIIRVFDTQFIIKDLHLKMTTSIGVCFYPEGGSDLETLLRNADLAMYRAKEVGKNIYQIFQPSACGENSSGQKP